MKFFQNNAILVLGWFILSSIITLGTSYKFVSEAYKSSIGYKGQLYSKIQKLSTKQSIDYFKNVLGTPNIINKKQVNEEGKIYIFINNYFYIKAITNKENEVISFSVTSRKKDFQPTYTIFSPLIQDNKYSKLFTITLNKTTFYKIEKISDEDSYCNYQWWPKGFSYVEGYYLGGTGDYQSIYIGIDDNGYIGDYISNNLWSPDIDSIIDCSEISDSFRKNKVNSFMITSDFNQTVLTNHKQIKIGVDSGEVGLSY